MGCYCDVIGIRSFARFESKEDDYNEKILNQFIQYSGRPVFSMEAATRHPLQSFADLITIEEYKKTAVRSRHDLGTTSESPAASRT